MSLSTHRPARQQILPCFASHSLDSSIRYRRPPNFPSHPPRLSGSEQISRSVQFTQSVVRSLESWYFVLSIRPTITSSAFLMRRLSVALLACSLLSSPLFIAGCSNEGDATTASSAVANPAAAKSNIVDGDQLKKRLDDAIAFTQSS